MTSFNKYLKEQQKDPVFKEAFEEEKELRNLAFMLNEKRLKKGKTQSAVAKDAHLTQQQYSKLENGENCNIMTYLKASRAMGYKLTLEPLKQNRRLTHV